MRYYHQLKRHIGFGKRIKTENKTSKMQIKKYGLQLGVFFIVFCKWHLYYD